MDDRGPQLELLTTLESLQDDLLRRIDELDQRVQKVLAEWTASSHTGGSETAG